MFIHAVGVVGWTPMITNKLLIMLYLYYNAEEQKLYADSSPIYNTKHVNYWWSDISNIQMVEGGVYRAANMRNECIALFPVIGTSLAYKLANT